MVSREKYNNEALYQYREYLRDKLDDPMEDNRSERDKFVWTESPKVIISKDNARLPFISISRNGQGEMSEIGGGTKNMETGRENSIGFDIRVVTAQSKHKKLADQICDVTLDKSDLGDVGSGPNYDYDLSNLVKPEIVSSPSDRNEETSHEYRESALAVTFESVFGGR